VPVAAPYLVNDQCMHRSIQANAATCRRIFHRCISKLKGRGRISPHLRAEKRSRGDPREASKKVVSDLSGSFF
jgi:hypothetical protein